VPLGQHGRIILKELVTRSRKIILTTPPTTKGNMLNNKSTDKRSLLTRMPH